MKLLACVHQFCLDGVLKQMTQVLNKVTESLHGSSVADAWLHLELPANKAWFHPLPLDETALRKVALFTNMQAEHSEGDLMQKWAN